MQDTLGAARRPHAETSETLGRRVRRVRKKRLWTGSILALGSRDASRENRVFQEVTLGTREALGGRSRERNRLDTRLSGT
jgi:hypothetical protein